MIANRRFGVEFEMMLNIHAARAIVRELGVNWTVKEDGSVQFGCEIVSPILQGEEGLNEVRKVLNKLQSSDAYINRNCGFHVHVDAAGLSKDDIKNAVKRYSKFERDIDSWHISNRRGNNNTYCQGMASVVNRLDMWMDNRSLLNTVLEGLRYGLGNSQADRRLLKLIDMLTEGATLSEMASETGLAQNSIKVMISTKLRKERNLYIKLQRWTGKYKILRRIANVTNAPVAPLDSVFKNIPPKVVGYLKERAYELNS